MKKKSRIILTIFVLYCILIVIFIFYLSKNYELGINIHDTSFASEFFPFDDTQIYEKVTEMKIGYVERNDVLKQEITLLEIFYFGTCEYKYVKLSRKGVDHYYIGGIEIPKPLTEYKSRHRKDLNLTDRTEYNKDLIEMLNTWEEFAISNDIPYVQVAGGLLGYCRNGKPLYYDDDFDVIVSVSSKAFFEKSGFPMLKKRGRIPDFDKIINHTMYACLLYMFEDVKKGPLFVLFDRENKNRPFLDVFPMESGKHIFGKENVGEYGWEDFPLIDMCGFKTRFPKSVDNEEKKVEICENWLDKRFGTDWKLMRVPGVKNHIPLDFKFH